jgi:cupin fold WbuC family metalloprotein
MNVPVKTVSPSEEVLIAQEPLVRVDQSYIDYLKARARGNRRRRVRLCAHPSTDSKVHEMLIVHARGTYVRPHLHLHKAESYHVIEGRADVVLFSPEGVMEGVVPLGEPGSGRVFFFRLEDMRYHSFIVQSDVFVFHETTNGPFVRADMQFAPWAPPDEDETGVEAFLRKMTEYVKRHG